MIISVNWLKKFTEIDGSIDEFATLIGSRLVEIEEIVDFGKKYEGAVIAKVVECQPLEGSDHLNIAKIDDGNTVQDVERDENGLVQVVCGAPNVRVGIMVAWLPPKTIVPETFGKEPFVLEARKLRGAMSNGMLASQRELSIGDAHEGILEVDKDVAAGTKFADAYDLNDHLLDIENKSLTHRPDTFGIVGFAREVAAIQGKQFQTPTVLASPEPEWLEKTGNLETPSVTIENAELSQRYQAVVVANADAKKQSSLEMQIDLARLGVRPISAVVDVTNYLMMLTGQPLHAFDYDKLKAVNDGVVDMRVRAGREDETLTLLDGRAITLSTNDIVIANGDTAVALAGAMGGADTEIDENTTSILLESATFNLYNLRNTQMRHGIFSEAITRFTKGQPAALTAPVLAEAVRLLNTATGAERVSDVADCYPGNQPKGTVEVSATALNNALGSAFTIEEILTTLRHVECNAEQIDGIVKVTPPYWRTDINIAEDIIEEVGRLNGFDSIMPRLPGRDFTAVSPSRFDTLRSRVRTALVRAGANEVLTYSFVHGDLLKKAGLNPDNSYRLVNSLSPDLQYYRQTLTPSMVHLVHPNIKSGFDTFALFELNKVHQKALGLNSESVPVEVDRIALTLASKKTSGDAYYQAKTMLDYVASLLGITFAYTPLPAESSAVEDTPFEYRRSAIVVDKLSGGRIGVIGEYTSSVAKAFKLPAYSAGFELDAGALYEAMQGVESSYSPLSRYPSTERDICFRVNKDVTYDALVHEVQGALHEATLETAIEPVDIYAENDSHTKNVTLRIKLTSHQKTLTSQDTVAIIESVVARAKAVGAVVV